MSRRAEVLSYLLSWHAHWLLSPQRYTPWVLTFPYRDVCWEGWAESQVGSHCVAASGHPSCVPSQGPWAFPSIHLLETLWSLGSSVTSRISSPARIFTFSLPCPLLSETTSSDQQPFFLGAAVFSRIQSPWFSSLNSACAEAQSVISLLIHDFISCLLINRRIQDMPLLFNQVLLKFSSCSYQLQLTSTRFSAWGPGSSVLDVLPSTHTIISCLLTFTVQAIFYLGHPFTLGKSRKVLHYRLQGPSCYFHPNYSPSYNFFSPNWISICGDCLHEDFLSGNNLLSLFFLFCTHPIPLWQNLCFSYSPGHVPKSAFTSHTSPCSAHLYLISAFKCVKLHFLVWEMIDTLGWILIALYKDGIMWLPLTFMGVV